MNLGGRLRKARELRGIEGKALAERVGMSQPRLSALETRDSKTCEQAAELADALGVSLRWLVSGDGSPEDVDWPFPLVSRQRWAALPSEARGYVQAVTNRAIDEVTGAATSGEAPKAPAPALSEQALQVAAWLDAAPAERRDELFAYWNLARSLVAQGHRVQVTEAPSAQPSKAAGSRAPTAKPVRSR